MADSGENRRICALDGCEETFVPPPQARHKRFCCVNHQRRAEKRRYRANHTETAICAYPHCGKSFERTTKSGPHHQVYCSTRCQYRARSISYRQRLDIQANFRRAREIRAWGTPSDAEGPDRRGGDLGLCTDSGFGAEGGFGEGRI